MSDIKITTNELKLRAKLKKKEGRLDSNMLIGMKRALLKLRGQEVKDLTAGRYGLKTRSGRLRNSLAIVVRKSGSKIIGLLGTGLPYAPAHEFGTTIRPKTKKYLTIPAKGIKGRALEYQNTFFHRKGGSLLLMQKTGPQSTRLLFTLVKQVRVTKKKWMSRSFKAHKKDLLMMLRKSLREAIA